MLSLLVLAILQGFTEFLPISSSGHLVLAKALFGLQEHGATIEIFLHFGTLISIIVFYRKKLWAILREIFCGKFNDPSAKFAWLILWASIPAGIIGVIWADYLEELFSNPKFTSFMLIITAVFLLSTLLIKAREKFRWNLLSSLLVGLAQTVAILPGISRSGATIIAALWLGAKADSAAEFSFILAIPAISGAVLIKAIKYFSAGIYPDASLWIAALVSAIVGYAILGIFTKIINKGKFWVFGIYCFVIGVLGLMFV